MKPLNDKSVDAILVFAALIIALGATSAVLVQQGQSRPKVTRKMTETTRNIALTGEWLGELNVNATCLRLGVRFAESNGDRTGEFLSIDEESPQVGIDYIAFEGGWLLFDIHKLGVRYVGQYDSENDRIIGKWKQGPVTYLLEFARVHKFPELLRPQTPQGPFPYREIPVLANSSTDDCVLAGTLTLPAGEGPFPAVILISGSGQQNRDSELFCHRPFFVLADHLTRQGIAVLRMDDRGVGQSTGGVAELTLNTTIGDIRDSLGTLRQRSDIDRSRIGLFGHSEGGLVAAAIASADPSVAFIILAAAPGLRGDRIIEQQIVTLSKSRHECEERALITVGAQQRIIKTLKQGQSLEQLTNALKKILSEVPPTADEAAILDADEIQGNIDHNVTMLLHPWFRDYISRDPRELYKGVRCPVLVIAGDRDRQVEVNDNVAAIMSALAVSNASKVKRVILPRHNHLLQSCDTGDPSEYARISETISPQALEAISNFVREFCRMKKEQGAVPENRRHKRMGGRA